ncbi:MAG: phenylalanine--tRNA ligase subunit beta [Anaerolineales bacterium]|nr:phenylalanine--tRNA ligase subunit beta [Anaerolineales bacterium]
MLVPLSWLKDFVTIDLSVAEVDTILTNAGLEVKYTNYVGLPGADLEWDREKIILAQILKVEQHPDADKLVLATVDYGVETNKTVVTGAPNLIPFVGHGNLTEKQLYSPLALEGATLYDGHKAELKKAKLKGRPLRGIYNDSMLCSEKELGISDQHDGIIIMHKDKWSPDYQVGMPVQDVLGDAVLDIDIIPNIARCASIIGVAREYAALTDQPLQEPDYEVVMEGPPIDGRIRITTEEPKLNPRFVGMVIEGVEQKASPHWLQHRLRLAGQRPINVVVDISNYVMLEMGQPNHTFDYDFLRKRADEYDPDGPIHIITRLPHAGEKVTTLDGSKHTPEPYTILVTDPAGYLSIGGIMGGLDSEIMPDTTNVLLEAAAWNFINIRRSSTRLGIHTDAAFRFSRGVHPHEALLGARRAAELLRRLANGTVSQGILDYYPYPPKPVTVELSPAYVQRLSGLDISPDDIVQLLTRLQFKVDAYGDHLLVTVPEHRMDIDGPHDLVEEICRMYGYDNIPSTILSDVLPPQRGNPTLEAEEKIRDILVQLGLQEIITYRLTSAEKEANLLPSANQVLADDRPYVTLTNPISTDRAVMRHSVLSSALEIVAKNSRFQERIALFEIGAAYIMEEEGILPHEAVCLVLTLTGQREPSHWHVDAIPTFDFFDLKGTLECLFTSLNLDVQYKAAIHPSYRPGRTAKIMVGNSQVGLMGELHPLVVERYDMHLDTDQPVLAADLDLEQLLQHMGEAYTFEPITSYPAVHEDLALVVDQDVKAVDVETAVFKAGGFLLKKVTLFDVYTGLQIPAGKKSLAYHLTFQSPTKTLTDKDVSKMRNRIIKTVENQLGAKLRA